MQSIGFTFRRCKLVVGGSAIALKILADEPGLDANLCKTCNLSIHGFFSKDKYNMCYSHQEMKMQIHPHHIMNELSIPSTHLQKRYSEQQSHTCYQIAQINTNLQFVLLINK